MKKKKEKSGKDWSHDCPQGMVVHYSAAWSSSQSVSADSMNFTNDSQDSGQLVRISKYNNKGYAHFTKKTKQKQNYVNSWFTKKI